jgi:hypothetical protein
VSYSASNEVTSADGGRRVLIAFVAQWPAAAEFRRWASMQIMRVHIILIVCALGLIGCSTPNRNPKATTAAYEQLKYGMSREEVYALLGQPQSVEPVGDVAHCHTARWTIPHNSHGWGRWTITFDTDAVTGIKHNNATVSFGH